MSSAAGRGGDWPLRCLLLGVLAGLLIALSVVPSLRAHRRGPIVVAVVPPAAVVTSTTSLLRPPRRPGRRDQVSPGCGLSLAPGVADAPVGHCTVLEIGDSLGNDLGWGLARQVPPGSGLQLVQLDRSATGLADSSYYDWPGQLAADLRTYHPQLVLISLGGNDEQGMEVQGAPVQFPSAAWQSAYLARVTALIREATAAGAYVVWVGLPVMQQPSYSEGIATLNGLYQDAVRAQPHAVFVSTWALFAGPEGRYDADALVDGQPAGLREADGIHYSFVGENVVATYVIQQVGALGHVALAPAATATITGWS